MNGRRTEHDSLSPLARLLAAAALLTIVTSTALGIALSADDHRTLAALVLFGLIVVPFGAAVGFAAMARRSADALRCGEEDDGVR